MFVGVPDNELNSARILVPLHAKRSHVGEKKNTGLRQIMQVSFGHQFCGYVDCLL